MNRPVGEWVRLGLFTPLIVRVVWYTTSPLRGAASQLRRAIPQPKFWSYMVSNRANRISSFSQLGACSGSNSPDIPNSNPVEPSSFLQPENALNAFRNQCC